MTTDRLEQRRAALTAGNARRALISQLRHELKAMPRGEAVAVVADVLTANNPDLGALTIQRLLTSIQGIGPVALRRLCCGVVDPYARLRDVNTLAAVVLAEHLRKWEST